MENLLLSLRDKDAIQASIEAADKLADIALDQKANPTTGDSWHDESFGRASIEEGINRSSARGLELMLEQATIIEVDPTNNYEVNLESLALIKYMDDGTEQYLYLVGIAIGEINFPENWEMVSLRTPIGQCLLGAHYGDIKECAGRSFKILDIISPNEMARMIKEMSATKKKRKKRSRKAGS